MNKISKIVIVLLIAIMLVMAVQSNVFAADYLSGISATDETANMADLKGMANKVLGLIQAATAILAVILIAVFGFKFVLGSAQEKADYQKSFIPLIVGVVVVFAAVSIAKLIFSVAGA